MMILFLMKKNVRNKQMQTINIILLMEDLSIFSSTKIVDKKFVFYV
jgi:hypothetical protein